MATFSWKFPQDGGAIGTELVTVVNIYDSTLQNNQAFVSAGDLLLFLILFGNF